MDFRELGNRCIFLIVVLWVLVLWSVLGSKVSSEYVLVRECVYYESERLRFVVSHSEKNLFTVCYWT